MKLYFTINALSHCDWKDCTAQLVEEVQDKHVVLVAEENNVDCNAVRVHFAGKVAGYVCRDDAPVVRALITSEGRQSRLATVTGHTEGPYYKLKAELDYDDTTPLAIDDHLNQLYDAWEYTGPLLPPSVEQKQLEGAVEYLGYVIGGQVGWDDEGRSYFETFVRYHRQDYSDEMFNFRHRLMKFLYGNDNTEHERKLMERELDEMSRHEHRDGIGRYIEGLTATEEFWQMLAMQNHIDKNKLQTQMDNFPENLTHVLLEDGSLFCSRLYYIHPRRKVLRQFFSGIALLQFLKQNDLQEKKQQNGTARKFTLVEIVDYCKKCVEWRNAESIVAMLNKLLGRIATPEDSDLVDSIETEFFNRRVGNNYYAPVGQVLEHVDRVENKNG